MHVVTLVVLKTGKFHIKSMKKLKIDLFLDQFQKYVP